MERYRTLSGFGAVAGTAWKFELLALQPSFCQDVFWLHLASAGPVAGKRCLPRHPSGSLLSCCYLLVGSCH